MKKIVLLLLAIAGLAFGAGFGTSSTEQDVLMENPDNGKQNRFLIGTATDSSMYYKVGTKIANGVKSGYAVTTDGSGQNLDLLSEGKINVALVQGDVFNLWLNSHPAYANKFTVLVTDRTEHVQLIMRKGMTEDDLQKKGSKVFVGLQKSGGAGSYRNMQLLEPNYVAEPIFGEIDTIALTDLVNKKYDGIIRTSHIEPGNELSIKVLQNPALYFADIDDNDLDDKITLNGETKQVYEFVSQNFEKGPFATSAKVLETKCYIVISNELTSRKQRAEIADIIATYRTSLFQ